jgi:lipoprotein-anchoring transpeptidase ErfK/SrfK
MKRTLLPALLLAVALSSGTARAQGFNLGEPGPPAPAQGGSNLGGGFIEFLFTGGRMAEPMPAASRSVYGGRQKIAPQAGYAVVPRAQRYAYALPPSATAEAPVQPAMDERFLPQQVAYRGSHRPGTIVIDTEQRFLYLVEAGGTAMRYGVGVGREGFEWKGVRTIERKAEWPDWRPPAQMLRRRPDLPRYMPGGPENPLGARAIYLAGTLYRIHGSNEPQSIGHAVSSGCIRMRNEDVIDLYDRVKVGTTVVVM